MRRAPLLASVFLIVAATACGAASRVQGGDDAGADAADGGTLCGEPAALAGYTTCRGATEQGPCEDAGGTWITIGLAPEPECQCPTGQGGCPCTSGADCLSSCIGELPGGLNGDCTGVAAHCSPVSITVGCWCWFGEGMSGPICVD